MTDTPARIWAWVAHIGDRRTPCRIWSNHDGPLPDNEKTGYIRADLVPRWQPIETAPKDGEKFLGYWPDDLGNNSECAVTTWWGGGAWESPFESSNDMTAPTHWKPLDTPEE